MIRKSVLFYILFKQEHRLFLIVLSLEVPTCTAQPRARRCHWKHSHLDKWFLVQTSWEGSWRCNNNCTEANESSGCAIK